MRSFIAATLISAVAAETYTAWSTDVETITSCAASITDCPARETHSASAPGNYGWGSAPASSAASTTEAWSSAATPSSAVWTETSKTWVESASSSVWTETSATWTESASTSVWTVTKPASSAVTTSATTWTETETKPASSSVWTESKPASSPVTSAVTTESMITPSAPATWAYQSSGAAHPSGSCSPGHPGWPGYTGASSGWAKSVKPTGTGAWSAPSPSVSVVPYTGAAAAVNAAGLFAGAGAILAFFL